MAQTEKQKHHVKLDDEPAPVQFSLRSILIATAICAVMLGVGPSLGWWGLSFCTLTYTISVSLSIAMIAYGLGGLLSRWTRLCQTSVPRIAGRVFLIACTLLTYYAFWWRYRWTWAVLEDPGWPRPWPYPDTLLITFHDWLDKRNPPPPGYFKCEGEFFTVLRTLNLVYLGLLAVTAGAFGITRPRLPRAIWRSWPVRLPREQIARTFRRRKDE